ncbi:ERMES complex Ca(2+)-binding regulatory GTPase gem1 [Terramyces sp. JEL0728]|nr:ERMES complex Ca(2+)-binding regulatory GTPase gem1 [Terramyces sp. JEL0728]
MFGLFKKRRGKIEITDTFTWTEENTNKPSIQIPLVKIQKQQVNKKKYILQLDVGELIRFNFETEAQMNLVVELLKEKLAVKLDKVQIESRKTILKSDNNFEFLHKELVISGILSEQEFWQNKQGLLAQKEHQISQKKGTTSILLADVKPVDADGSDLKVVVDADIIHSIFTEYPGIEKAYKENVPDKMKEDEFWKEYFTWKYFKKKNEKHDIFTKYQDIDQELIYEAQNKLLDLVSTTEDHLETGNSPDITMKPGKIKESKSLIRKFNRHSELIVNKRQKTKVNIEYEDLVESNPVVYKPLLIQDPTQYMNTEQSHTPPPEITRPKLDIRSMTIDKLYNKVINKNEKKAENSGTVGDTRNCTIVLELLSQYYQGGDKTKMRETMKKYKLDKEFKSVSDAIQHVVPEVTIPPEWTRENVTTRIVDSSARPENRDQLDTEIKKADVPVVLVGNKIDLRGKDVANDTLDEQVKPIMNEFKEVETCVECSAKQPLNVSEVFYFAQKAVLHPTAPLYDSREYVLKPACIDALRRIFKLCDIDKNGYLDDNEIDTFQKKCFGAPLQKHELESVKTVVMQNEPEGVTELGLSEIGFICLHTLFIQRGRLETTWTVLRTFGYGDDLTLKEEFLFPNLEVPPESSVELSSHGYQFFTDLFQIFDKDNDGALNQQELEDLFSTAPAIPWEDTAHKQCFTNEEGNITLQGFLAQWSMITLLNYKTTLSYLAYLGFFDSDTTKALKVTKPRKQDRKRGGKIQRDVFLSYVFGAAGSGKMQEFGPNLEAEILQNKKKLDACDLICMVYDSGDANSFAYLASIRSDLDLVAQRYPMQPDTYCRDLGLAVPMSVSMKTGVTADLFNMLVGICMNP